MGFMNALAGYLGYEKRGRRKRSYAAASIDRLTSSWTTQSLSADAEIKAGLQIVKARSRELTLNNDYAKKFVNHMVPTNIVGPNGIKFQSKVMAGGRMKLDKKANSQIEASFARWCKKQNASVSGKESHRDQQVLFIKTVARDGEALVRKVFNADNPFGFALQFLDTDILDENLNVEKLGNGNKIRLGVESDSWDRPVAYHLLTSQPGDFVNDFSGKRYERVSASRIIHSFIGDRSNQTRGMPWMHSAMTRLNMVGGFEEAALVNARGGASKMGFFETPDGDTYQGDEEDGNGNIIKDVSPGEFEQLPQGVKFVPYDPTYPTGEFQPFVKAILRGIASGLSVSYNTLASDLEGVNYSSIRQGVLDERDCWRTLQTWMIEHFCEDVFTSWLESAFLTGHFKLPFEQFDRFEAGQRWQPRGWSWVDPLKDAKASIASVNNALKTRTQIVAEQGHDFEDILTQLAEEKELAESLGVTLNNGDNNEPEENKNGNAIPKD